MFPGIRRDSLEEKWCQGVDIPRIPACIANDPDYEPPAPGPLWHDTRCHADIRPGVQSWTSSVTQECQGDKNTFNVMWPTLIDLYTVFTSKWQMWREQYSF